MSGVHPVQYWFEKKISEKKYIYINKKRKVNSTQESEIQQEDENMNQSKR